MFFGCKNYVKYLISSHSVSLESYQLFELHARKVSPSSFIYMKILHTNLQFMWSHVRLAYPSAPFEITNLTGFSLRNEIIPPPS